MIRTVATTGKRIGYGWLYNWYAVNHASGLAPDGWRVPSDTEWTEMTDHLIATYTGITSSNVGGSLKSTRNEWDSPNTGATNEFGFSALPGGFRFPNGSFANLGYHGYLWSATDSSATTAWSRRVTYESSILSRYYGSYSKADGLSVRCIQDKLSGEVDGDTGTLTDIDGNVYRYVVIGAYRWMAENLRTTKYRNGVSIPEITDNTAWANDTTGARCAYDNDHYYVYPPGK